MSESADASPQPNGEHYREVARRLREVARECRFANARQEILNLAARYDRRADHFDR
jgi:hypothetical protein